MKTRQKIHADADKAVRQAQERFGIELTFDRDGVEWIDGQLRRLINHLSPPQKVEAIEAIGAFLGECMVREYDGEWVEKPGGIWMVEISRTYVVAANVFGKVERQLAGIKGESILTHFDGILVTAETGKAP